MDSLDDILVRNYKKIKGDLISNKEECLSETLFWNYVRGELTEDEKEKIDGHLVSCRACLESFKVIKMIQQAEKSTQAVPVSLHKRAQEILQNELKKSGLQQKNKPVIMKIALLWNQVLNRITQAGSEFEDMLIPHGLEFQPVRKAQKETKENQCSFPYRMAGEIDEGIISLEIDRSSKEGYLLLKVSLELRSGKVSDKTGNVRAVLYKSDKIYSSVYLNSQGEAIFSHLREGKYCLEILAKERSLGVIDLSLARV